jgi:aspartate carbamoyltransferase catalytic subunit
MTKPIKHLITLESISTEWIESIFDKAQGFLDTSGNIIKKPHLAHKTLMNLFFEPSTRTRTTFEIAAKSLGMQVVNLDVQQSSTSKGEALIDMIKNLEAMGPDIFVVRHHQSGAPAFIAKHLTRPVSVINAGDGHHQHPTQGLLDAFTVLRHKGAIKDLSIAIVGDILHSRVARSNIAVYRSLGVKDIRLIGPKTLLPENVEAFGAQVFHDMNEGLKDVDVIIMLRLQKERMTHAKIPSLNAYFHNYGLTAQRLKQAKSNAAVLHPGPINRQVEIDSDVADGPQSLILNQVTYGIAIRMAVIETFLDNQHA